MKTILKNTLAILFWVLILGIGISTEHGTVAMLIMFIVAAVYVKLVNRVFED